MGFTDLQIKVRYRSDNDDLVKDFMLPVLAKTNLYKRAVGFFSSSALIALTVGLFELAKKGGKIQLICSPKLSEEDIYAINTGYRVKEDVFIDSLQNSINEPVTKFEEERLNLVATLIANGTLDIRLAFMENDNGINIYHEKIAVFIDEDDNKIAFAGSANASMNAYESNFESFYTFCSWKDLSQKEGADIAEEDFDRLWCDKTEKLRIIPFPQVVIEKILSYKKDNIDFLTDEKEYLKVEVNSVDATSSFQLPEEVSLFPHQKDAISEWFNQGNRGIFSMCTGAGKTFTALAGMVKLAHEKQDNLAVFIVCPYIHLVSQWEEDLEGWGPLPIIAHSKSPDINWQTKLQSAYRRFRQTGKPFICICSNDTFFDEKIQRFVTQFSNEQNVLLIVDEAHNWGAEKRMKKFPNNIEYRIALSATIKRHMDKKGTKAITDYFGEICAEYTLKEGIADGTLVHYEYYPIPVYLEDDELAAYVNLTKQLSRYLIYEDGKTKISEVGKQIIFKRTRLLAGAINKIELLLRLIEPFHQSSNILIYCGAASIHDEDTGAIRRQIDIITEKLSIEYGMSVKRFTSDEDLSERQHIKKYFSQGMYQAITAIRCLDEGVNIPGIKTAFIMSSSRNPKEFVQRRGRLLRKSSGKEKAVIYDFITLPRDLDQVMYGDFESDKTILIGEISRMEEFASLADNPRDTDQLITRIMESYDAYFDVKEEMEKMEEYYGG